MMEWANETTKDKIHLEISQSRNLRLVPGPGGKQSLVADEPHSVAFVSYLGTRFQGRPIFSFLPQAPKTGSWLGSIIPEDSFLTLMVNGMPFDGEIMVVKESDLITIERAVAAVVPTGSNLIAIGVSADVFDALCKISKGEE
jgi:hypothetical protein